MTTTYGVKQFSNECHKIKTKVITLANLKRRAILHCTHVVDV